jgi:HD-GYP domain-containing protein (c-di-GMP phosphodiesterase class II)
MKLALNEIRKATDKGCYDPKVVDVLFEVLRPGAPSSG